MGGEKGQKRSSKNLFWLRKRDISERKIREKSMKGMAVARKKFESRRDTIQAHVSR
jgi:hypothetical protein